MARDAERRVFRLIRNFTVARLLEREDFRSRMAAEQPVSALELLYPALQGYDSVAIDADVELGGTDQKFNLLFGRDVQQASGKPPQSVMTMPILPGIEGKARMSKSAGNYIGVSEPPEEVFGKAMRVPDEVMPDYFRLVLGIEPDPSATPARRSGTSPASLVTRFHGEEAAREAEVRFDQLHITHEIPEDVAEVELVAGDERPGPPSARPWRGLRALPLGGPPDDRAGRGPDRRRGAGGGEVSTSTPRELEGSVLQVGKRRHARIRIAAP